MCLLFSTHFLKQDKSILCLSVCLSICLSILVSVCLSLHRYVCLSISLSVCLWLDSCLICRVLLCIRPSWIRPSCIRPSCLRPSRFCCLIVRGTGRSCIWPSCIRPLCIRPSWSFRPRHFFISKKTLDLLWLWIPSSVHKFPQIPLFQIDYI